MTAPTPMIATGGITIRLPGSDRDITIAGFQVAVPYVVSVNAEGVAEGLVDQDALRANLADALTAAAGELRKGA